MPSSRTCFGAIPHRPVLWKPPALAPKRRLVAGTGVAVAFLRLAAIQTMQYFSFLLGAFLTLTAATLNAQVRFVPLATEPVGWAVANGDGSRVWLLSPRLDGTGQGVNVRYWDPHAGVLPYGAIPDLPYRGVSADGATLFLQDGNRAALWTRAQGLQTLDLLPGWSSSQGEGLSGDGRVAFGWLQTPVQSQACRWVDGGTPQVLAGIPAGVSIARILDVNHSGEACVGLSTAGPFRWTVASGFTAFFTQWNSLDKVTGISEDGETVVGMVGAPSQAFLWTQANGIQWLPGLGGASQMAYAKVSPDGSKVVGLSSEPWFWSLSTGTLHWKDYLQQLGVSGLGDWEFGVAIDFASTGCVVTGAAYPLVNGGLGPRAQWVTYLEGGPAGTVGAASCTPNQRNSTEWVGVLFAHGSATVSDQDLRLSAQFLPPGQIGYFLNSQGLDFVAQPGNSAGNLCLGGAFSIQRHNRPGEIGLSDAQGLLGLELDLQNMPGPQVPFAIQAGQTWHFQCWYRDPGPLGVSNFTDAVTVDFL